MKEHCGVLKQKGRVTVGTAELEQHNILLNTNPYLWIDDDEVFSHVLKVSKRY